MIAHTVRSSPWCGGPKRLRSANYGWLTPDVRDRLLSFRLINRREPQVVHGGSWLFSVRYCRSAFRYRFRPGLRHVYLGFRLIERRSR